MRPQWCTASPEGIPQEKRVKLFRELSRLHPSTVSGAGLGLTISQKIAAARGGEITVESSVGEGSVFTLRLPAQRLEEV